MVAVKALPLSCPPFIFVKKKTFDELSLIFIKFSKFSYKCPCGKKTFCFKPLTGQILDSKHITIDGLCLLLESVQQTTPIQMFRCSRMVNIMKILQAGGMSLLVTINLELTFAKNSIFFYTWSLNLVF